MAERKEVTAEDKKSTHNVEEASPDEKTDPKPETHGANVSPSSKENVPEESHKQEETEYIQNVRAVRKNNRPWMR